ncbi:unnamed protein product [Trichobilharzia regenti]|nr:unnamed protein product [Trichobilharzia regenti]
MTRCTRGGSGGPNGLVNNALVFETMGIGFEPRWEHHHSLGNAGNERDKSDYKKAKFTPYHMDSLPSLTSSNLSTVKQHTNRSRLKALRFLSKPIPKKTRSFYVINMSAPSVCCIRHQRLLLQICTLLLLLLQICKFV